MTKTNNGSNWGCIIPILIFVASYFLLGGAEVDGVAGVLVLLFFSGLITMLLMKVVEWIREQFE